MLPNLSRTPGFRALTLGILVATFLIPNSVFVAPLRAAERFCPGGLLVVMNRSIDIPSIDDVELRRLFLGKSRRLPNGARAALASYGPEATFFNERLLGLSDAEVATVWARLRFAGRTPPPRTFDSSDAVLEFVASRENALAYLPACVSTDRVRVFSSLPRR